MSALILLVDAPNIVMRCAFGGAMPAEHAVPLAVSAIRRAANFVGAEFLILAFDTPRPTWREELCPAYKSHRTVDTTPFTAAARIVFERHGWFCLTVPGFEADDDIATMVDRLKRRSDAAILSSSSIARTCRWSSSMRGSTGRSCTWSACATASSPREGYPWSTRR